MESYTPPTPTKPIPSTQIIHTPIHTPPTHILLPLGIREDPICLGELQDFLNDTIHEDNSLNKDSDALVRMFKPHPIISQRLLGNTNINKKIFYGKQQHGGGNKKKHQDVGEINRKKYGEQLSYKFGS